MKKLSPQQKILVDLHKTGNWVCSTEIEYMRDHRKRYSELTEKGFVFEAEPCNGVCLKKHASKLFMRRIAQKPTKMITKVREIEGKYYPYQVPVPLF